MRESKLKNSFWNICILMSQFMEFAGLDHIRKPRPLTMNSDPGQEFPLPAILFPAVSSTCYWRCPRPADKPTHHGSAWTKPPKRLNPQLQTPFMSGAAALSHHVCEAFSAQHWDIGGCLTFNRFSQTKMIWASWADSFSWKEKSCRAQNVLLLWKLTESGFSAGDHFCGWVVATA